MVRYFVSGLLLLCFACPVFGEAPFDTDPLMKVEIDWEIRLFEPDLSNGTPQISLIISAFPHVDSWHSELTLNSYTTSKGKEEGGITSILWNGRTQGPTATSKHGLKLNTTNDVIYVKQSLALAEEEDASCKSLWSIHESSQSNSWGAVSRYGAGTSLHSLENLNQFNVDVSIAESGVAAGKNRVDKIILKTLKLYQDSGAVNEVSINRVVHAGLLGTLNGAKTLNSDGTYSN